MHSRSVLCMTGHYNFYYVCMYDKSSLRLRWSTRLLYECDHYDYNLHVKFLSYVRIIVVVSPVPVSWLYHTLLMTTALLVLSKVIFCGVMDHRVEHVSLYIAN